GKSPPPSPRPPAAQRASAVDARAQQLDLDAQFSDPLHRRGELTRGRVRLAFLQRAIQRGFGLPPPALELVQRHTELAREILGGLAPQQTKHHLSFTTHARSEERRVGKECSSQRARAQYD